jgi:hypothetical protein
LLLPEIQELQSYQDDPRQPCTAVNALLDVYISQVRFQITALQSLERWEPTEFGKKSYAKVLRASVAAGTSRTPACGSVQAAAAEQARSETLEEQLTRLRNSTPPKRKSKPWTAAKPKNDP